MLTNNPLITSLGYEKMPTEKIKNMSFSQYIAEAGSQIVPPSGQPIAPTGPANNTNQGSQTSGAAGAKAIWPGKGAPVQQGMTVGLKGQNGLPVPGQVSQVDQGANGVKVKNPTTGQDEWYNTDDLQPFLGNGANSGQATQGTTGVVQANEDKDLIRLRELAGLNNIRENCSAGATGAGAIAIAPTGAGNKKPMKREYTQEARPVEYTPKEPAKTIIGDTKPNQATGKLSADLAARGQKTASRTNNGFKK